MSVSGASPVGSVRRKVVGLVPALVITVAAVGSTAQAQSFRFVTEGSRGSGWLGFEYVVATVGPESEDRTISLVVRQVVEGSPAHGAELRAGDRVLELNGRTLTSDVLGTLSRLEPGDQVTLTLGRGPWNRRVVIEAAPRPAFSLMTVPEEMVVRMNSAMRRLETLRIAMIEASSAGGTTVRTDGPVFDPILGAGLPQAFAIGPDSVRTLVIQGGRGSLEWVAAVDGLDEVVTVPQIGSRFSFSTVFPELEEAERSTRHLLETGPGGRFEVRIERSLSPYIAGRNMVAGAAATVLNPELATYFEVSAGLLVTDVMIGTPAHEAGIRPGDVLVRMDSVRLNSLDALREALVRPVQGPIGLTLVRQGTTLQVSLAR